MISVIVPIYNIEKYIDKCISSIINQTYKDLEIILVDDGSSDKSGVICDEYADKDSRIKVLHKENGGLSDARNAGIDIACGEYIGFVDGDDFIHPQMYEFLLNGLVTNDADLILCKHNVVNDQESVTLEKRKNYYVSCVVDNEKVAELPCSLDTDIIVAWNKLYKRELFRNIRYEKGRLHEDQWIAPYLYCEAKKVIILNDKLYYYIKRANSITGNTIDFKRRKDIIESFINSCLVYKNKSIWSAQRTMARHTCNYIMDSYLLAKDKSEKKCLRQYFSKVMIDNGNVFSVKQVMYHVFNIFPQIGLLLKGLRE